MKYLLDTANLEQIERYCEYLPVAGVTTNPTIVKREGKLDFFEHMRKIRQLIGAEKELHIQVTASDAQGMLRDAHRILREVDPFVYIKIPTTQEGIKAIRLLKAEKTVVTATAIYTKQQGYLAMEAGADCLAPYYNRIEGIGADPWEIISAFAEAIDRYGYSARILAASFKNPGQVDKAFSAGAQAATLAPEILEMALNMPSIRNAVDKFSGDWSEIYGNLMIADL